MDEIGSLGPHFAFEVHDSLPPQDGTWRPLLELLDGSAALIERYQAVCSALTAISGREVEFRVAASTGHLGLVARLLCPMFGAALLGCSLDLSLAWWQPVIGGAMPLSLPHNAFGPTVDESSLLAGPIAALVERTEELSVSPKVLWGNVSSAVNGAVMTAGRARPDLAERAMTIGQHLMTAQHLTTAQGQMTGPGPTASPGPDFRRDSCCLIYRIAPEGSPQYCGDCVLTVRDI